MFASSPSVAMSSNKEKFCTFPTCSRPKGHLETECHTKFPHLKKEWIKKKEANNQKKAKNVTGLADDPYQPQAWTVRKQALVASSVPPQNVIRFNMDSGCTDTTVLNFNHLINQDKSDKAQQQFAIADDRLIKASGTGTLPGTQRDICA
jgi:hypothetical protein